MFRKTKNTEKLSIYRVGEPTGAILKATVNIKIHHTGSEPDPDLDV